MYSEGIIIAIASSIKHLEGIMTLQALNHASSLTRQEKKSNGYVTLEHSLNQLTTMMASSSQIVAMKDGQVVGYALSLMQENRNMFPILRTMFERIDSIAMSNKKMSYYVMGQVCIHERYRGQGIFKSLYDEHKKVFSSQYDVCITEVSVHNIPSMKAHKKVGFIPLLNFEDSQDKWSIISWDWS